MRIDISNIIIDELEKTKSDIINSMKSNNQYVTGRTAASLYVKADNDSGAIYGADYIDTLEKGISPERSRQNPFRETYSGLLRWYQSKGYSTGFTKDRRVYVAAVNQRVVGSVLFRQGGRFNVYSDKVNPLVNNIKERVADVIINTKILE